eukprot:gene13172-13303_t
MKALSTLQMPSQHQQMDVSLRGFCSSTFLDTAVSALIVVGLLVGSVVLSGALLVQVGEESRQAVVHLNTLVRQKGSEAALTTGVWSLLQQYEGQVTTLLQESLPGLAQVAESAATDFLMRHNMSKVLLDLENVRVVLKLPSDCSPETRVRLAVQLANSSVAAAQLGQQRDDLQAAAEAEQRRLRRLAAELEALWADLPLPAAAAAAGMHRQTSLLIRRELPSSCSWRSFACRTANQLKVLSTKALAAAAVVAAPVQVVAAASLWAPC